VSEYVSSEVDIPGDWRAMSDAELEALAEHLERVDGSDARSCILRMELEDRAGVRVGINHGVWASG
jgi:hypothetical protein